MREIVIFDTEFTAWEGSVARRWGGPGEHQEIVQIGAVILDGESLRELSKFDVLIRPELNPVLSQYFTELTGISQAMVGVHGLSLTQGVEDFRAFAGDRELYCYGRDDRVIANSFELRGLPNPWPAILASDIGRWFVSVGVEVHGVNSGALAQAVGGSSNSQEHNALNDARSIAEAIRILVLKGHASPF